MVVRGLEQTNRVSTEYSMIIERSGMEWNEACRSIDGITDRFVQDQQEWKEHL